MELFIFIISFCFFVGFVIIIANNLIKFLNWLYNHGYLSMCDIDEPDNEIDIN